MNREGNNLKLQRKKPTEEFSIVAKFLTKRMLRLMQCPGRLNPFGGQETDLALKIWGSTNFSLFSIINLMLIEFYGRNLGVLISI